MESNKDLWWGPIVLVILFAIIGLACFCLVTGKNIDAVSVVVAALILKLGTMLDYRYGSSKGSKDKSEAINEQLKTPNP